MQCVRVIAALLYLVAVVFGALAVLTFLTRTQQLAAWQVILIASALALVAGRAAEARRRA